MRKLVSAKQSAVPAGHRRRRTAGASGRGADRRGPGLPGRAPPPLHPAPGRAARAPCGAPRRDRPHQHPGLPPRDRPHPGRPGLACRPGPARARGPPGGDHRPHRPQDDHQRPQLRRQELRPAARRHPGHRRHPAARLAPRRAPSARRRRPPGPRRPRGLRAVLLPQRPPAAHPGPGAVLLPPQDRVPPRGPPLERRLRLRAGPALHSARDDPRHRSDRDDHGGVRDGRDPLRAPRPRLRAQRGPLGLPLLDRQELPRRRSRFRPPRSQRGHDDRPVHARLHRTARPHLPQARRPRDRRHAAFIPSRRDPEVNAVAFDKVKADKDREAGDGFDGSWVAHPDLVPVARASFDAVLGDRPHQKERLREDVHVTAAELIDIASLDAAPTQQGLRNAVQVGIRYIEAWLRGLGAVAIFNLMEDAATAEISRSQIWQWVNAGVVFENGEKATADRVRKVAAEELAAIREEVGEDAFAAGRWSRAHDLLLRVALDENYAEFLTLPATPDRRLGCGPGPLPSLRRVELGARHDLLGHAGAGPQQLHMGLTGLLGVLDPDGVLRSGAQRDGRLVDLWTVRGGGVDDQTAVDPHPRGVVGDGRERVGLAVPGLEMAGPADAEVVGGDIGGRGAGEPPGVVDGRIGPGDGRRPGEGLIGEDLLPQPLAPPLGCGRGRFHRQLDHRRGVVGRSAGGGEVETVARLRHLDPLSAAQHPGADHRERRLRGEVEGLTGGGPGGDGRVQPVARPADRAPGRLVDQPGGPGPVHRPALSRGPQPGTDLAQPVHGGLGHPAQFVGADVQQVVAAAARDVEEIAAAGHGRVRDLLLGRSVVAVDHPPLADPVVGDQIGVESVQIGLEPLTVLGGPAVGGVVRVPFPVEPEQRRVITVDQLLELGVHPLLIAREGGGVGEVGVVPVPDRVVEAEFDPGGVRGGLQLGEDVAPLVERGVVAQVPAVLLGGPHRIAVVVLGGDDDVALPGVLGRLDDGLGVEGRGVEVLSGVLVLVHRNLAVPLDPLRVSADGPVRPPVFALQLGVGAEVDEHPEAVLPPPVGAGGGERIVGRVVGPGSGLPRGRGRRGGGGRAAEDRRQHHAEQQAERSEGDDGPSSGRTHGGSCARGVVGQEGWPAAYGNLEPERWDVNGARAPLTGRP
ncbi:hypothetical protein Lal_00002641 [Lupinus albus]|nr:hypothetical protein Lal_00002641 [Lupinus albus]